ncbi:conjugal transfer protein TraD [Sphingomonas koreensis]
MRKPKDFDAELRALAHKAKQLKERQVRQLGELVVATGADALDADLLAGALLEAVATKDDARREGWRKRGAAFFHLARRSTARGPQSRARSAPPVESGKLPLEGTDRTS